MKLRSYHQTIQQQLIEIYEQVEAESISKTFICHFFDIEWKSFNAKLDVELDELKCNQLTPLLERLAKGEPIQYITEIAFFYGLVLEVNPSVLIPRPETEELIQIIVKNEQDINSIYDFCSGSGCISLALKMAYSLVSVTGFDISKEALMVSNKNAQKSNLAVNFIALDILDKSSLDSLPYPDIIVSNPPYVLEKEKTTLHKNVLDYEPHLALFVEDDNPFVFFERIMEYVKESPQPIKIYFEGNQDNMLELEQKINNMGFSDTFIQKDFRGNNRFLIIKFNGTTK